MRINALLSLIVFSSLSLFARAQEVSSSVDWSGGTVGKPATTEIFPNVRFASKAQQADQFMIVGAEGSLVNPFAHLEKSLALQRGEQGSAPTIVFPLPGKVGYGKGSFTFEVFLPPGEGAKSEGFRFSLRTVEQGSRPTSAGVFRVSTNGLTFQETTDAPVVKSKTKLSIGATNTIRIDWDFELKSGYNVFLNDQPVTIASGGADSFFPVSASEVKGGVRELLIFPRANVTLFIGKVTGSAK